LHFRNLTDTFYNSYLQINKFFLLEEQKSDKLVDPKDAKQMLVMSILTLEKYVQAKELSQTQKLRYLGADGERERR
jgi:hypothetical protein